MDVRDEADRATARDVEDAIWRGLFEMVRLTQEQAAEIFGGWYKTSRRYIDGYQGGVIEGLSDRRLKQVWFHLAPVYEVMVVTDSCTNRYPGFNVKHFYTLYRREADSHSYTLVEKTL